VSTGAKSAIACFFQKLLFRRTHYDRFKRINQQQATDKLRCVKIFEPGQHHHTRSTKPAATTVLNMGATIS
jgi:hypothetical protein